MNNPPQPDPPSLPRSPGFFSWRTLRRLLLTLAFLVTIIALFYAEEDWRGKRAWDRCKRDLDAKGVNYNWSTLIPPPVPDDQNFFKAPGINEDDWMGRGRKPLSDAIEAARCEAPTNNFFIADVAIFPPGKPGPLPIDDTNTPVLIRQSIDNLLGPTLRSARSFLFTATSIDQIRPAHFQLLSDKTPTPEEIAKLFPRYVAFVQYDQPQYSILAECAGSNSFRVNLRATPISAADFLARASSFEPILDIISEALKRPYQRMDGDYSRPDLIPIPNFVMLRSLAQLLADRAKCHLLLHNPNEALRDILLLHDICKVTESNPTGQPMALVAAMIHVAIIGLYADTIADSLTTHIWTEPNLIALQDQLAHTDLLPFLVTSFQDERVSSVTTITETLVRDDYKLIHFGVNDDWPSRIKQTLWSLAPRGWLYQNAVLFFTLQPLDQIGDPGRGMVFPEKARQVQEEQDQVSQKGSPYSYMVAGFRPNGSRAWQTLARNQTSANQALIACVLERFRLSHGDYPETLDALIPQYIDKLPHDLIGGQPLHYRRQSSNTFLLYSIGWNQTDDGGQSVVDKNGFDSYESGDWVWPNKPTY